MGSFIEQIDSWVVAIGFASAMLAAWGQGWRIERKRPRENELDPGIKFTDASMALLGLLLGFTFSMALSRHEHRRLAVVAESNAIGDFYTCASMLQEPQRSRLQVVIRDYARHKFDITRGLLSESSLDAAIRRSQEMQNRMTELTADAVLKGTPVAVPLANTLNEVASSAASRLDAYRDRLPWSIILLLVLSAVVPAFLMGKQQGVAQKPHLTGTLGFILLVTMVVDVTLDLNHPGRGMIKISQESLERLLQSMSLPDPSQVP